jgi:hypothetical protein
MRYTLYSKRKIKCNSKQRGFNMDLEGFLIGISFAAIVTGGCLWLVRSHKNKDK